MFKSAFYSKQSLKRQNTSFDEESDEHIFSYGKYSPAGKNQHKKNNHRLGGYFVHFLDKVRKPVLHFHVNIFGEFTQHINIASEFIIVPSENFGMTNRNHNVLRKLNTETL